MKRLFIYSAFTILLFSCQKNIASIANAKIVGQDFNKCACCGGLEVTIDNHQSPNGQYFLVGQLPSDFVLGNNPQYPIDVTIEYTIDTSRCAGIYVDITKIEKH